MAGVFDVVKRIANHLANDVHTLAQPPQSHGDAAHSVTYEKTSNKNASNGYMGLDASSKAATANLPYDIATNHKASEVHTAAQVPQIHDNTKHSAAYISSQTLPNPTTNNWTNESYIDDGSYGTAASHSRTSAGSADIIYDFGSVKALFVGLSCNITNNSNQTGHITLSYSLDNVTYYNMDSLDAGAGANITNGLNGFCLARYVRIRATLDATSGTGACNYSAYEATVWG